MIALNLGMFALNLALLAWTTSRARRERRRAQWIARLNQGNACLCGAPIENNRTNCGECVCS